MSLPPLHVGQIGLLFDIVGAVFLARAIFFNSVGMISAQGGTYYGYNPHLIKALCEQRIDASFGLPLLCVGFAFQFWATVNNIATELCTGIGGAILIATVILYFSTRSIFAQRLSARIIASKSSGE